MGSKHGLMKALHTISVCLVALTCHASHHVVYYPKAIHSPKGAEQDVPMLIDGIVKSGYNSPAPLITTPPRPFHTPIAWDYPSNALSDIENFRIYSGPTHTNYTTNTLSGKVLTNSFAWFKGTTNFLSVTAIGTNGMESEYSNEIRLPADPLTNFVITVTTTRATNLQWSLSLAGPWTKLGKTNWSQTNPPPLFWRAMGRSLTSAARAYISSRAQ